MRLLTLMLASPLCGDLQVLRTAVIWAESPRIRGAAVLAWRLPERRPEQLPDCGELDSEMTACAGVAQAMLKELAGSMPRV